jgi:HlyD family secretion protein
MEGRAVSARSTALAVVRPSPSRAEAAKEAAALSLVRQYESESAALGEMSVPRWARVTVLTLAGFFVACIVIASLTRIDRVISSQGGKIVSAQPIAVLQALDASIIKSIDVREGDEVKAGQVLGTLDPTFAAADVNQLRLQIASLEAQIARDEAQLNGRPLTLPQAVSGPELRSYAALQRNYYDQQQAQYKAQLSSFDAKMKQAEATIEKFKTDEARYKERQDIAQKVENMRATLEAHGSGSLLNLLSSQDARLEVQRTLDYDHHSLVEAQSTLASLAADRDAFIQQWFAQLSQDLVTARNSLDSANAQYDKAVKHKDLVRLAAAEDSVVLSVAQLSVGSVLKEGDTLFTLMPAGAPVETEMRIASRDIGFLRPGDRCVVKVEAFNYMEHGMAEGVVLWISDNAFTTDSDGKQVDAYYKARCNVDTGSFRNVPAKFRLIPGMTLQADVKVGTRSVAMYLVGGVLRGLAEAMREP